MIEKKYYLGKYEYKDKEVFFIGIHRGTDGDYQPYDPHQGCVKNCVLNNLTSRVISSFERLKGYLIALRGEFAFEEGSTLI